MLEVEKKEKAESAFSSSIIGSIRRAVAPKDNASKPEKSQAFINEEVLVGIHNDVFPCTAEQFYNLLLIDDCSFTNEYRAVRKDTNLSMGQWHPADDYDGLVREITFRTICNSPVCPPDTAMTEYQHSVLSPDKKKLVFETVQQAHDVPFGSYFEVHCQWCVETSGENSSILDVKVGAHFKKWCVMQSKIRSGAINEYKKEVEVMLDVARSYIKSHTAGGETNNSSSSPPVLQQGEMDFRQDTGFSHVVSWCKKITGAKRRKKIYPSLRPKTEYLFDLRDSVKEEMIKELMVGTKRTKECREWLIKVREFEANAKELLQFHEKISDNLRFSKKQPHVDLMNVLDEITRLLESSPLQRATRTRSSSMIEGKNFGLAERTSNAYLRSKTEDPVDTYLEAARSRAMGKEVEKGKEILLIKDGTKLLSSSRKAEGDQKPRNMTKKKGSFFSLPQVETKDGSTTAVGSMIDMEAPLSGNSGAFWSESSLITSSSLPSDAVDLKTKPEEVSSSQTNILPTAGQETKLISFEEEEAEEETKPSQRPEISKTVLNEIEEISSSHETESETSLPAASQIPESLKTVNQSVEPPIEVGAFISPQREIFSLDRLSVASSEEEILLPDEVETKGPSQTDAKANVERTVLKILELLSNDTVRRIGVCGTGKVGKTTVLKAFIDHPQINDMFDLIIWVTVSKDWSIRKMQDEVLRQLSTDFKAESENREELLRYLEGRKFLLVLDDVWESIDLEAVGIPNPSSENGSAIILATRNLKVCGNMRFINMNEVGTLSNEEAWKLFCEHVGRVVNKPRILPFARVIAERCGGLPLLVIVTGSALSGEEDVFAWEQAFKQFSGPCGDLRSRNDIIQLLKFSFDRLQVHDIQSCFLHCALFPEDQEVNISEFVKYCIEEGLIAGNTADAYKRSNEIITVLRRAFLLETTSNSSIIMHDMIRDLALAILLQEKGSQFLFRAYSKPVSRENHSSLVLRESPELFIPDGCQFILRGGSRLTQPPSVEEWGKSSMIFLMDNNLSSLPESPSCPGLLTLFLQRNFRLRVIPVSFFDCMPCLKVLNLSNTRIKSLPRTISKLVSLETLILRHCERLSMLPSDIGSLKLLQVLDLRGTEINLLPDEIGELSSLTYFDICFYGSINRREHLKLPQGLISSGIISRLCALQSLGIKVCPGDERWDKCVKSIIYEVSKLTGLTSLSFYFPEVELLELFLQKSAAWIDQCLTEYNFVVGHDIKRIVSRVPQYVELDYDRTSQRLRFVNGEKIPDAIVKVLAYCSAFYLDHHLDVISISKFGIANMNKLKHCIVSECPTVKAVLDDKEFTEVVFPCLEHLNLHYLWNLEYICNDLLPEGSFAMLRILYVHACPKLKYVLKSSMLCFFLKLEELIVDDCTAIKKIILDDDMTTELSHMSDSSFKRLTLHYLPALETIREGVWPSFEYISVCNCPNFKKINLDSKSKHTLKGIKGEKDWWDSLEWKEPSLSIHFNDLFTLVSEDDI